MAISHAGHDHPATPAGRRACRAGNPAPATSNPMTVTTDYIGDHIRKVAANSRMKARMDREYAEIKMTGPVARRMARQAMKAQNAQKSGGCVQAALHTGQGRCACGWHTEGF